MVENEPMEGTKEDLSEDRKEKKKSLKLNKRDFDAIKEYVLKELKTRQDSPFRKQHEMLWKEVDRMVAMKAREKVSKDGRKIDPEWRSTVELGELSIASELLSADIRRLSFPSAREWFSAHSEVNGELDPESGKETIDEEHQEFVDTTLQALMAQQHSDFGFMHRVDLSVKEALHHGSYVAEVRHEVIQHVGDGGKIRNLKAPVWEPHSMWNCYPVANNNPFYDKSMIIVKYMSIEDARSNPKWINRNKIEKQTNNKDEDVRVVKYWGDITIKRNGKERVIPNVKVEIANDTLVYAAPNESEYSNIIYNGYERMDVRDPYFVSPLMKQAANQVIGCTLINKFVDGIAKVVEPPIAYDGNDPQFVRDGGPDLSPGAKSPSKNLAGIKELSVGDPTAALEGYMTLRDQIQQGLGVDRNRAGVAESVEQTATEVIKTSQFAEIRTVNFVDKHEQFGLKPFLYMQHAMNLEHLDEYTFYNDAMNAKDFMTATKKDLPNRVHFEVVGSRGILGEEQRQRASLEWTTFLLSNPQTAPIVNIVNVAKEGYRDAGVKEPERFLNVSDKDQLMLQQTQQAIAQVQQQAEQAIGQLQQQIEQMNSELLKKDEEIQRLKTDYNAVQELRKIEQAEHRFHHDTQVPDGSQVF